MDMHKIRAMGNAFVIPSTISMVLICSLASIPLHAQQDCGEINDQLAKYRTTNPIDDADAILRLGAPKLLGIYGYALIVPGLTEKEAICYAKVLSVEPIPGTSDFIRCPNQATLNREATKYAEKFNKRILLYIQGKGVKGKESRDP